MISYKLFKDRGIPLRKVEKLDNSYIISSRDNKYYVKERNPEVEHNLHYLASRSFNHFPNFFILDKYDVYEYIDDTDLSIEEQVFEMTDLISLLHTKTTRYENISIDDYKAIYEDLMNKIEYLNNYYMNLNDRIDEEIYMSPSSYLLALNISKVYSALYFCKNELDNWYSMIENSTRRRTVLIHNELDLNNFRFNGNSYLIGWEKSKIDLPIYDLIDIYKKYYNILDFDIILKRYQKRYPLSADELKLLFVIISIPEKIDFTSDELDNVKRVKHLINSLDKSDRLIRPYYLNKEKKENPAR